MKNLDFVPKAKTTKGSKIILEDNKTLIDGVSSWWTSCHGYNHPYILDAMNKQLTEMPHIMFGGFSHSPAEKLATKLVGMFKGIYEHVFFVDSGSVAIEVAMKCLFSIGLIKEEKLKKNLYVLKTVTTEIL